MELELRKKELDVQIYNIMIGKIICDPQVKDNLINECREIKKQIKELKPQVPIKIKRKKICREICICNDCKIKFNANKELYCENCYIQYKNNAIEIITSDKSIIYNVNQEEEIKQILGSMSFDIRLDLHGVASILEPTLILSDKKICVISFVGKNSLTRELAKKEIKERIDSGQIELGILNFIRSIKKQHSVGTKAFINKYIKYENEAIFIDDSIDHIQATNNLNIKSIKSIHFIENDPNVLRNIISKL